GSRPAEDADKTQTVQPRLAVMALIDLHCRDREAVAIGRQGVELARAAIAAIAIYEFTGLDGPIDIGHGSLPNVGPSRGRHAAPTSLSAQRDYTRIKLWPDRSIRHTSLVLQPPSYALARSGRDQGCETPSRPRRSNNRR